MSGVLFNEIDDTSADSTKLILDNRGSGPRHLEKRSKNGNFWVTNGKIFLHKMRIDSIAVSLFTNITIRE